MESELGTLYIPIHRIIDKAGKVIYNVGTEYFEPLQPRERYRTSRYTELIMDYATDTSYRKIERRINRIRQQSKGAKTTTIRNIVEREGLALNTQVQKKAVEALHENGFSADGKLKETAHFKLETYTSMDEADVMAAAEELGISDTIIPSDYESPEQTVNISVDDVGTKRQVSKRPNSPEKGKRKYVNQTVIHAGHKDGGYTLNAKNQNSALTMLMGFLLHNDLFWDKWIVFFIDGETVLRQGIEKLYGFMPIKTILDWYHLNKKVKERLSSGMAGYKLRNAFLDEFRPLLWKGDVQGAISMLKSLPENQVKSGDNIQKLIEYLERNKEYIPCYALRAKLGMCNSSNRGEKANDLAVSKRQKHNGMSWSKEGSLGLASVCVAEQNDQLLEWVYEQNVSFSLRRKAV